MSKTGRETKRERELRVIARFCNTKFFHNSFWYYDEINPKDARNLLILLYRIGVLSDIVDVNAGHVSDGYEYDANYNEYFDFRSDVKINKNTGRIIHLCLRRYIPDYDDDESELDPFDLPPIIERFQGLESIELEECCLLPIELSNLPLLKEIELNNCTCSLSELIPEGLQLALMKRVVLHESTIHGLSTFLNLTSDSLEEIHIRDVKTEASNEFLRVLQNDDLICRQSLTTIRMTCCNITGYHLEKLLFYIRPLFSNFRTLDLTNNCIESFLPIEDRIKKIFQAQMMSLPTSSSLRSLHFLSDNNSLCELNLSDNPVMNRIIISKDHPCIKRNTKRTRKKSKKQTDHGDEKRALLVLLNTFNRISNLGLKCEISYGDYDPDIKQVLKTNIAGTKFIMGRGGNEEEGGRERERERERRQDISGTYSTQVIMNRVLWPTIFERAYQKSADIYKNEDGDGIEIINSRTKCGTGVFHLVKHCWPLFMEDHRIDSKQDDTTTTTTTNDVHNNSKDGDDGSNGNNTRLQFKCNRKRKN